jgi:hypothetical protein
MTEFFYLLIFVTDQHLDVRISEVGSFLPSLNVGS